MLLLEKNQFNASFLKQGTIFQLSFYIHDSIIWIALLKANFYVYLKSVYTVDSLVNMEERDTIRLSCER